MKRATWAVLVGAFLGFLVGAGPVFGFGSGGTGSGGSGGVIVIDGGVPPTRAITAGTGLTGGGDLSADRAISCGTASGAATGCLSSTDWTTFNNKVATTRTVGTGTATSTGLSGGGDLSADRTLSCASASATSVGCVNLADQTMSGIKRFSDVVVANGTYAHTAFASGGTSVIAAGAVSAGGPIYNGVANNDLLLVGRRTNTDPGVGVTVAAETYRDAGVEFAVYKRTGGFGQIFSIQSNGDVVFTGAPSVDGTSNADAFTGTLRNGNSVSGHVALMAYPGLYLSLSGQNPSEYVGVHGAVTVRNKLPMDGGYIFEAQNPATGTSGDKKFLIGYKGRFGTYDPSGGYQDYTASANLPACSAATGLDNEHPEGLIKYRSDDKEWVTCDGADWKTVGTFGVITAYYQGKTPSAANQQIMHTHALEKGAVKFLDGAVDSSGTGASNWTVRVYNVTTSTVLCTTGSIACTAAAGTDLGDVSCNGAFAKNDELAIQVNTSACANSPAMNVAVSYR